MSRTTLDIDDDVLAAAKERAAGQGTTTGKVISELVREALTRSLIPDEKPRYRNGFRLLPRTGQIITSEMVRKWLDEDV
jgi:hypothetical protein